MGKHFLLKVLCLVCVEQKQKWLFSYFKNCLNFPNLNPSVSLCDITTKDPLLYSVESTIAFSAMVTVSISVSDKIF